MNCIKCGRILADGMNFCPNCGESVARQGCNAFCSVCGAELVSGAQFCTSCGTKVENRNSQAANAVAAQSDNLIISIKANMVEKVGVVNAAKAGMLAIFDDRIEFGRTFSNSPAVVGGMFGGAVGGAIAGAVSAANQQKKQKSFIYRFDQIKSITAQKRGIMPSSLSIYPVVGIPAIFSFSCNNYVWQEIINVLQPYIR